MKDTVILYHHNCSDGFGAAWAAHKKFGSRASYIGVNHNEPPPQGLKNKKIYLVDFSYPIETIKKIIKENKSIAIIDHHISAEKIIKKIPDHLYALNHSGAVLSWRYFHPKEKTPRLLLVIEDTDLGKFKLPFTKELITSLRTYETNFILWNKIAKEWQNSQTIKKYIQEGKIFLKYKKIIIKEILSRAQKVRFEGYKTLAVNSPIFQSEIGYILCRQLPPMGIIWHQKSGKTLVSLRSNKKVDVSKLAGRFGGGGHKVAAGFSLPLKKPFPWIPL